MHNVRSNGLGESGDSSHELVDQTPGVLRWLVIALLLASPFLSALSLLPTCRADSGPQDISSAGSSGRRLLVPSMELPREKPSDPALAIIFEDGRPARWDPLIRRGEHLYWGLARAALALDAQVAWDPMTLRGSLEWPADSLFLRFIAGSPIMTRGEQAIQLLAPVTCASNRVLLPLDFLSAALLDTSTTAETAKSLPWIFDPSVPALLSRPQDPYLAAIETRTRRQRTTVTLTFASADTGADVTNSGQLARIKSCRADSWR